MVPFAGKIRAELNLEKWPAIWQPSKSKNERALRVFEREINNADGSDVLSRVEVGYTQLGTLTTEDQKMYYALIHLWEESGKPADQPVFFSDRLLARVLRKSWGTNVRDTIVKSLRKLRTIPIEWINSYHQRTEDGKHVLRERTPFTILSELKIVEKETDGTVNRAVGYFKSDDRILKNLLANYTKPLFLDTILKLKSDIAQLLYVHVDLMLARKDAYERRTKELFLDLGLTNPEYKRQYERYRALRNAVAELQGVRLSTGVVRVARIEKTIDGLDYKVSFRKSAAPEISAPLGDEVQPAVVIYHYLKSKDPLAAQAEEIVRHFHQIVHGVEHHEPQSKELGQAQALLSKYAFGRTKHIVEFVAGKAAETNFKIQHFGAVLAYASRGVADFDARQRQVSAERRESQPVELQTAGKPGRGAARLATLTEDEYRRRFELVKAELFHQFPFLAERSHGGSKLQESIIRSHLIRRLDKEVMDIAPLDAFRLPEPLAKILALGAAKNPETTPWSDQQENADQGSVLKL